MCSSSLSYVLSRALCSSHHTLLCTVTQSHACSSSHSFSSSVSSVWSCVCSHHLACLFSCSLAISHSQVHLLSSMLFLSLAPLLSYYCAHSFPFALSHTSICSFTVTLAWFLVVALLLSFVLSLLLSCPLAFLPSHLIFFSVISLSPPHPTPHSLTLSFISNLCYLIFSRKKKKRKKKSFLLLRKWPGISDTR